MDCPAFITDKAANDLYARLNAIQGTDGCALDELETDKTRMTILWKSGDRALPLAEVVRKECASSGATIGPTLAIRVPSALAAKCPSTVPAAVAVIEKTAFDAPPAGPMMPGSLRLLGFVAGAVALAVIVFNVIMVLRHRARAAS
jgi:hypothetical protein